MRCERTIAGLYGYRSWLHLKGRSRGGVENAPERRKFGPRLGPSLAVPRSHGQAWLHGVHIIDVCDGFRQSLSRGLYFSWTCFFPVLVRLQVPHKPPNILHLTKPTVQNFRASTLVSTVFQCRTRRHSRTYSSPVIGGNVNSVQPATTAIHTSAPVKTRITAT